VLSSFARQLVLGGLCLFVAKGFGLVRFVTVLFITFTTGLMSGGIGFDGAYLLSGQLG
jgi:hypothetical protein